MSTLLAPLVIPTVYEIMDGGRARSLQWLKRLFGQRPPHVPEPAPPGPVEPQVEPEAEAEAP